MLRQSLKTFLKSLKFYFTPLGIMSIFYVIGIYVFLNGGVGETRTLAPVTRSTSLAGKPLHQLGYYSRANAPYINIKSERN